MPKLTQEQIQKDKLTKEQIQKEVLSYQIKHASLLSEMGVQTQQELEDEIDQIVPEMDGEMGEEVGYERYNWGDPLRWMWEITYMIRLNKMQEKLKLALQQMVSEQMKIMSFIVIIVAALSAQFKMTCFEILSLLAVVWVSLQLLQIAKTMISMELFMRKLVSSSDHMEFGQSNSAGNMVKLTRSLFEKVSYIEKRMMHLTADKVDMERQMYQVISESWDFKVGKHKFQLRELQAKDTTKARPPQPLSN